jgi:hypothetical protein
LSPLGLSLDRATTDQVPTKRVRWQATYRLVSARHPPIDTFERIASPEDRRVLDALEKLTDPASRQAIGQISLVPASKRVFGPGASAAMAPFTHASRDNPSRFSNGSYGVYYAGRKFATALYEVAYHRGRFHAATRDPPLNAPFKTYIAGINKMMHDVRTGSWADLLDPNPSNYGLPQAFGAELRKAGSNGIVYPSVRHAEGECIGAFWPNVVSMPVEGKRIALEWDGRAMVAWFDFETNAWSDL